MKVSLDISIPSPQWRGLARARSLARETVAACAADSGMPGVDRAEVSLCLADDAELRALNARFRGMDAPTNVLSFPSSAQTRAGKVMVLGDIALAYETLSREANALDAPLADHFRHLIVHGFLHLVGYDHRTDKEAKVMEALEVRILTRLGLADPYAR
jgi:probable rRNA maturation factor